MITGFRWAVEGGVVSVCNLICDFGKGIANGFSVAAVAGRREVMEVGSIDKSR